MVSKTWFQGLTEAVPKGVPKGGLEWPTFKWLRRTEPSPAKWLSPAEHVLIGDGTWRGVEPPPPRFRLMSLRHTPSMTLNLGGGTSFLFSNKVPVPPRPSQTASFAYGKRPRLKTPKPPFPKWTMQPGKRIPIDLLLHDDTLN